MDSDTSREKLLREVGLWNPKRGIYRSIDQWSPLNAETDHKLCACLYLVGAVNCPNGFQFRQRALFIAHDAKSAKS